MLRDDDGLEATLELTLPGDCCSNGLLKGVLTNRTPPLVLPANGEELPAVEVHTALGVLPTAA